MQKAALPVNVAARGPMFHWRMSSRSQEAAEIVALHEALEALQTVDPRKSKLVEMRYFGGLSIEETAEALGVSVRTVNRDWRLARSWLIREMNRQ